MNTIIAKALFNSHSYFEYKKMISDLLLKSKSTGKQQSEELTLYSSLNTTRMSRLEKTITISNENLSVLKDLKKDYLWIVISEGWCGDAAQLLPIFDKMATESSKNIEMKIVLRDENEALMNLFLTNKSKSIPKLIIIDKANGLFLDHWGPRPKAASDLIKEYKEKVGVVDENAKTELQLWYLHDKGTSTQNEIIAIMKALDEQ
jgi:hypothetical protein